MSSRVSVWVGGEFIYREPRTRDPSELDSLVGLVQTHRGAFLITPSSPSSLPSSNLALSNPLNLTALPSPQSKGS